MSGKVPHAAFVEEYDEDAHIILPETRQIANVAAKRSKTDLKSAFEPLTDAASDSGYSSRTAATVNSAQSGPSGRKSPPLKVDTALKKTDLERVRSNRRDPPKDRTGQPVREDKMQAGTYPSSSHHAHLQRSPSRRRRDSVRVRHYPGACWECEQGLHHPLTPVEPPPSMDFPYYASQSAHVHGYGTQPPSPQTPRHPPSAVQDLHVSHSGRPRARSNRATSYHSTNRPMSFHGMMPGMGGMMYNPSPMSPYEHGPPLSSPVWPNPPPYPSPHHSQQPPYFPVPEYIPPLEPPRDHSVSKSRDQSRRRPSLYGPSMADYDLSHVYEGGVPMEHRSSRERRPRILPQQAYDRDEDFYRMPPPPLKRKPAPQIIQKRPDPPRKSATTTSVNPDGRRAEAFDMSEMEAALPRYGYRQTSRETIIPERSRSTRDGRHNPAYYESSRRSRRTDEGERRNTAYYEPYRQSRHSEERGRRRRMSAYDYPGGEIEEKQREAEEYQAARSGKAAPVPLTADALSKAKKAQRAGSDGASQKSGSNSSRGIEGRSKAEDDKNIVMSMNGVTMSFSQESVGGKRINVRTGDTGAVEFNIAGKRAKKYLAGGTRSDNTSSSGRKELEDPRRTRDDRRSDRASRRSSHSNPSGGRFLE